MTKNYFTDEQVEQFAKATNLLEETPRGLAYTFADDAKLKALMNLAVEAAIGEPVGEYRIDYFNVDISKLNHNGKLYSVKELEN